MKSGTTLLLIALGTFIVATSAAPLSSEIQQDDDLSTRELLELIDRAARSQQGDDDDDDDDDDGDVLALLQELSEANEQQDDDDDDDDSELMKLINRAAQLQQDDDDIAAQGFGRFFRRFGRKVGRFVKRRGPGLLRGAGRLATGILGSLLNGGGNGGQGYGNQGGYQPQGGYKLANEQGREQDLKEVLRHLHRAAKSQQGLEDDDDMRTAKAQFFKRIFGIFKSLFG